VKRRKNFLRRQRGQNTAGATSSSPVQPVFTPTTDPGERCNADMVNAFEECVQHVLDATVGHEPQIAYGPSDTYYDADLDTIVLRPNWKPGIREPYRSVVKQTGSDPDKWPVCSTCSPFAGTVLGILLLAREHFTERWGGGMLSSTIPPGERYHKPDFYDPWFADRILWRNDRKMIHVWSTLPELHSPVSVAAHSNHCGLIIDCDVLALTHPLTREPLTGPWTLFMDGSATKREGQPKRFSASPTLRFQRVEDRANMELAGKGERKFTLGSCVLPDPLDYEGHSLLVIDPRRKGAA